PEVPHLLLPLMHLLFERFAPSFIIGNLTKRLAFLLTFPDGLSRVAERKDREDRDIHGNAQQGVDLRQVVVANPVCADTLRPCCQNHVLDSATAIGDSKGATIHSHNDRQWCLRDIGPRTCELTEPT